MHCNDAMSGCVRLKEVAWRATPSHEAKFSSAPAQNRCTRRLLCSASQGVGIEQRLRTGSPRNSIRQQISLSMVAADAVKEAAALLLAEKPAEPTLGSALCLSLRLRGCLRDLQIGQMSPLAGCAIACVSAGTEPTAK